jgi:hypothetical protein
MDMCNDVSMPTIVHFEYPQMMLKGERFYRDLWMENRKVVRNQ